MGAVAEHIADRPLLELIQRFLKQGVMESGKGWQPTEQGTPQGAVISPLLANLYLNPLGHLMARTGREWCATRTTLSFCARARTKPKRCWRNYAHGWPERG